MGVEGNVEITHGDLRDGVVEIILVPFLVGEIESERLDPAAAGGEGGAVAESSDVELGRVGEAEAEGVYVGLVEVVHPLIDEVHEDGPLHGFLLVGAVAIDEEFLVDVDVGGGVPEVTPSLRENGGSDGVSEGEEGDDHEEESVGEEGEVVGILHFGVGMGDDRLLLVVL